MNIQKVLLKVWRAIRDFVARRIDSSVARESKKASCAALRSNASQNAFVKSSKNASQKACGSCTRRALLSLFVASATLLATFVIAPTSALSAGENAGEKVGTEKAEGAQSGSAKNDDEKKQQTKQSEPNNTEPDKKNTGSSDALKNNNKESKPVEKQNPDSNKVDDKAKADEAAVKKNAKDAKNKAADSAKAVNGTDRSTKGEPQLHPECKGKYNTPEKCYSITYGNKNTVNIKGDNDRPYTKVPQIFKPTIEVAGKEQEILPNDVWLELKKFKSDDSVNYAFFKGENDKNDSYTAKSTKKVANSDGSIRFFPSKWLKTGKSYKFNVVIHYPDGSESKAKKIIARLAKDDLPNPKSGDLTVKVHNFGSADSTTQTGDSDKKSVSITINPKPKGSTPSVGTAGGADNKDTYDSINKLFIDSQSKYKRGELYHHMICKDDANNYTVDNFNGLSLKDKKDNPSADNQTKFKHMDGENRPSKDAADSAVYENDDYIERSQSWISGTPTSAGTFTCKVFAFKNANLERKGGGKHSIDSTVLDEFNARVKDNAGKDSLFQGNIVEDKWTNKASIKQGIDWDYKSVTIEVKSNKPPEPKPVDDNLTLKVYPFNGSPTALPDNKISAMIGMELKPFIEATSSADSANKITLRVLCSKGEKKKDNAAGGSGALTVGAGSSGSGAVGSGSSGATSGTSSNGANTSAGSIRSTQSGSQSGQPSGSSQPAENLEYKTWSSNLVDLGLSVPADTAQTRCNKANDGDKECTAKNVASQASMEVSIKPTEVGDYQCVVYALKPDALTKFDGLKGSLTPESIKSELTTASSTASSTAAPTAFKENKDFAAFTLNIHLSSNFTLPDTGGHSWNLQLGILAALLVNLLAAGFVVSQSERGRKLILGRWRGLCNHV